MLRQLAISLAIAGVISASNANALGLGEIKLTSALNEPLKAEIKLLKVRKLSPLQIQPRIANLDDFALAGLNKLGFLSDVSFQVKVNPDGSGSIHLSSQQPVREPFLNFLVEVNWPDGRLIREYTLLLDPPVYNPTAVRKGTATASQNVGSSTTYVPGKAGANISGRVRVGLKNTLWTIAEAHLPNQQVTVKQMMLALQKKNPQAFIENNMNAMRVGSVLDLPSLKDIHSHTNEEAEREFQRQLALWQAAQKQSMSSEPIQTVKAAVENKKVATQHAVPAVAQKKQQPKTEEKAKLSITKAPQPSVSQQPKPESQQQKLEPKPKMAQDSQEMQPAPKKDKALSEREMANRIGGFLTDFETKFKAENQKITGKLDQSLEGIDKISRENKDQAERIDSIQYEVDKLREMLELKHKEIAALQEQVASVALESAKASTQEQSLLDKILQTPMLLVGLATSLIAVLAGLLFFLRRGRKNKDQDSNEAPEQTVKSEPVKPTAEAVDEPEKVASEVEEAQEDDQISDLDDLLGAEDSDLVEDVDLDLTDDGLADLDDLDLDMDLDLEEEIEDLSEPLAENETEADLLDNEDFDLGVDDDLNAEEPKEMPQVDQDAVSEGGAKEPSQDSEEPDSVENEIEISDDLDFILADTGTEEGETFNSPHADDAEIIEADSELTQNDTETILADDNDAEETVGDEPVEVGALTQEEEIVPGESEVTAETDAEGVSAVEVEDDDIELADVLDSSGNAPDLIMDPELDVELESKASPTSTEMVEGLENEPIAGNSEIESTEIVEKAVTEDDLESLDDEFNDLDVDFSAAVGLKDTSDSVSESSLNEALDEGELELREIDLTEEKPITDDLESAIANDLDLELDSELDALLSSVDSDIDLEEDADDGLLETVETDDFNILEGADEIETKLDLARAYMDMEDFEGAKGILQEIAVEGSTEQKFEAESLLESINKA